MGVTTHVNANNNNKNNKQNNCSIGCGNRRRNIARYHQYIEKDIKQIKMIKAHFSIAITAVLFCILLVAPSDAFLKIGRKRAAAAARKFEADAGRQTYETLQDARAAEKRQLVEKRQQLADISNLVHDLKALKELKAIVDAKSLSTRDLEDFEKN